MFILGCQPAGDPASQPVESINEPRQGRRAWAPVLSSSAERTGPPSFSAFVGLLWSRACRPQALGECLLPAPSLLSPLTPTDLAFPLYSDAMLTAGRWVLLSPAGTHEWRV